MNIVRSTDADAKWPRSAMTTTVNDIRAWARQVTAISGYYNLLASWRVPLPFDLHYLLGLVYELRGGTQIIAHVVDYGKSLRGRWQTASTELRIGGYVRDAPKLSVKQAYDEALKVDELYAYVGARPRDGWAIPIEAADVRTLLRDEPHDRKIYAWLRYYGAAAETAASIMVLGPEKSYP
jgi:hypothetical protein